jgi:DNA-binding response OmpR family regulator
MAPEERAMRKRILVVDDEPDVRQGLRTLLEAEGLEVLEAADGKTGLEKAIEERPDAVILDLMIPLLDGFQVCRELRARGATTPVLILSARSGEVDKVLGFELGADDYITKPFGVRELVARLRALLRRAGAQGSPPELTVGDAVVDLRRYEARRGKKVMPLYHYEVEILKLLARREGEVVPRNEILDQVWGEDSFPTTRTVDFHVCNLRKKIEADPSKPRHILTVHGIGYRLVR